MNYWAIAGVERTHSDMKTKVSSLIKRVCESYEISEKELKSKRRFRELVEARQICQYVMHKVYGIPSAKTGLEFGKDHATVLYSCQSIAGYMEYDKDFRNKVNNIR